MKILAATILMLCSTAAYADCDNILAKEPQIAGSIRLCRAQESYLTVYNPLCKVPYYSAEIIRAGNITGANDRKNNFREDPALPPEVRSTLNDYKKTGFDRGHMAPAADFSYSGVAMSESFLLSNMIPQFHNPNAGIWSEAESYAREKAMQDDVRVISGPMFETLPIQYIGNGVCVPTSTFKIVIESNGNTTGFIVPNVQKIPAERQLYEFQVPVEEIEIKTHLKFN